MKNLSLQKKAQAHSQRLGQITGNTLNEIFIFDYNSLHFRQVNEGFLKYLGNSRSELIKMTPLDIRPEFGAESFGRRVLPLRTGKKKHVAFKIVHRRKDGTTYPIVVHFQVAVTDEILVFIAVIQDIKERKKVQQELELSVLRFRQLFDYMPFPSYIWQEEDGDFRPTASSKITGQLVQGKIYSAPGRLASELFLDDPDSREAMRFCFF